MLAANLQDDLKRKLLEFDQSHLVAHWDGLAEVDRTQLLAQLQSIDFAQMQALYQDSAASTDWGGLAAAADSPPGIKLHGSNPFSVDDARNAGEAALRDGKVGVILVAGGQGSRLGFPHPKGMYPIGPVSGRTLFQVLIDTHQATANKYGSSIPLYLMTSPATDAETRAYFQKNEHFGFSKEDLSIFCQGTMPAVDASTGKLLLANHNSLFLSPDGHGGTLAALERAGCLHDMTSRGIEYAFYYQVDNPMVSVADPEFIGYHILSQSEMTTQVIRKQDPREKVGNVVLHEDHLHVIEYSDLPAEAAARRLEDGTLALWAGSIAVHAFDTQFLQRMAADAESLPFHRARKAVPYIDDTGEPVEPIEPNAIKFERFIFDLMPHANNAIVVEVDEKKAFAPLKNAPGAPKDTAEYVQNAMLAEHRRWLEAAGADVPENARVEISPHFALHDAELAARVGELEPIGKDVFII